MNREDAVMGLPELMEQFYHGRGLEKISKKMKDEAGNTIRDRLSVLGEPTVDDPFLSPVPTKDGRHLRAYFSFSKDKEVADMKALRLLVDDDTWAKVVTVKPGSRSLKVEEVLD